MSEFPFVAKGIHRNIPMEKDEVKCSMCDDVLDTFYCGWNMDEYNANHYVCGEFKCWEDICLNMGNNHTPNYENYDDESDWWDAVQEEMEHEYIIEERK
tara:strand:- start:1326 stop:1622 length:297 start_codon:yes stop_codon:yes gene_type:complete